MTIIQYTGSTSFAQEMDTMPIVHDPVLIQDGSSYYIFSTGKGIGVLSSKDLKNWKKENPVFSDTLKWATNSIPGFKGDIWAPDISFHNGMYYLYYAVSAFGKNTSAIGVATNTTLDPGSAHFKWIDHGLVLQSVPGRDNWNAIDPNLVFDQYGKAWLAFGSFWGGLKLVQLDSTLSSIAQPQKWYTIAARTKDKPLSDSLAGNLAIEAPFIFRENGYFYLFASYDYCCRGDNSTYHVKVGRSKNVFGPYLDKDGISMLDGGGSEVIGKNSRFYAAGHNGIAALNGVDYFVCHGYDKMDHGIPKLIIKKIVWDDEWPRLVSID